MTSARVAGCADCAAVFEVAAARGPLPDRCPPCRDERRRALRRKDPDRRTLRVLSLGGGQQSSALLLMSLAGDLPPLDLVLFADTGWERQVVYDNVADLERRAAAAGVRFERLAAAGPLRAEALAGGHVPMPVFGWHDGQRVILRQTCTMNWKIRPIRRRIRQLAGPLHGLTVQMLLGISLEEVYRMKTSPVAYIEHVYPLIDARLTRADCVAYLAAAGLPEVPRSSCIGCPLRGAAEWQNMARNAPEEFADATEVDAALRARPGDPLFIHASRKPLPLAVIGAAGRQDQGDLFGQECEGHCGV